MVTGGLMALMVGILWLNVLTPRWLIHDASIAFLWLLLAIYVLALPAILAGGLWSTLAVARARRRHDRAALIRGLRWLLLASSCLAGWIAMEIDLAGKAAIVVPDPRAANPLRDVAGSAIDEIRHRPPG